MKVASRGLRLYLQQDACHVRDRRVPSTWLIPESDFTLEQQSFVVALISAGLICCCQDTKSISWWSLFEAENENMLVGEARVVAGQDRGLSCHQPLFGKLNFGSSRWSFPPSF